METVNNSQKPNQNYLILAIVATIFGCCSFLYVGFILGIIAIVFAAQVNSKYKIGDFDKAFKYAKYAKNLSLAAILTSVLSLCYIFYEVKTNPEKYRAIYEEFMKEYQKQLDKKGTIKVESVPQNN